MISQKKIPGFLLVALFFGLASCNNDGNGPQQPVAINASSSVDYSKLLTFSGSKNSGNGKIYEILPGQSVIDPSLNPTPFSNNIIETSGTYEFIVKDDVDVDSPGSTDEVLIVNIEFTANDGKKFEIDKINIIHKPDGVGDHTFFGGIGLNKVMHGDTGIGTGLMPKMLSYITLWGMVDLKNAETGDVVASNRIVHIMVGSRVRNKNLELIPTVENDLSNHDTWMAETHVILIPQDKDGNMSPVPGTAHGFLHMMWENIELTNDTRDWKKAYEILPGPSAINTAMSPTPFSDRIAFGSGSYSFEVIDNVDEDSEASTDILKNVNIKYQRPNGDMFMINNIEIIHKELGTGDHDYFGGVGINKVMHGNTSIGTNLMPKMLSYVTLWGIADLKDGSGAVLASNRLVHIMVASRARTEDLKLMTDVVNDVTDHSPDQYETHVILPPLDLDGNKSPVAGTGHGFLHLMFENVNLNIN